MNEKELRQLVVDNEYGMKLLQYYEQSDNSSFNYLYGVSPSCPEVISIAQVIWIKTYLNFKSRG